MKKFISLFLLMGALLIAIPPEVKAQVVDQTSKTEIYQEINAYRVQHGLQALEISPNIKSTSARHRNMQAVKYWFLLYAVSSTLIHASGDVNRLTIAIFLMSMLSPNIFNSSASSCS